MKDQCCRKLSDCENWGRSYIACRKQPGAEEGFCLIGCATSQPGVCATGICIRGHCIKRCKRQTDCEFSWHCEKGLCLQGCFDDLNCKKGQICPYPEGECIDGCRRDSDCRSTERCLKRRCQPRKRKPRRKPSRKGPRNP